MRGIDVIGRGLLTSIPQGAEALAKYVMDMKRREEVASLLSGLQQRTQPTLGPVRNPDPSMFPQLGNQGVPMFSEQNAGQLGRLAELAPQTFQALQATQPKTHYFSGDPEGLYSMQTDAGGNPSGPMQMLQAPMPKSVLPKSGSFEWTTNSPSGKIETQKIPGTSATRIYEYQINRDTGQYVLGPDGKPIRRLASGGSQPTGFMADIGIMPEYTKEFMYQNYKTNGVLPTFGMGVQGVKAKMEFINYAAKRAEQEGIPGAAFAAQKALFETGKQGLAQVTKMAETTQASAKTATENLDLVLSQLKGGYKPPTGSPILNEMAQWAKGKRLTGDANYQKYKNYIYTAVREYAKVVSGASGSVAGLTDTAAKEAEKVLNESMTPEAVVAALESMKDDMDRVVYGWKSQQYDLKKGMRGQAGKEVGEQPADPNASQQLSPKDQQAYDWAKANPNDPRAVKILQKLGRQ